MSLIPNLGVNYPNLGNIGSGAGTNLKVGGYIYGEKRGRIFWSCPSTFWLSKYNQSFWRAFSRWSVQFGQFIVCCSSTHGAPRAQPFVKEGGHVPPPPFDLGSGLFLFIYFVSINWHGKNRPDRRIN